MQEALAKEPATAVKVRSRREELRDNKNERKRGRKREAEVLSSTAGKTFVFSRIERTADASDGTASQES